MAWAAFFFTALSPCYFSLRGSQGWTEPKETVSQNESLCLTLLASGVCPNDKNDNIEKSMSIIQSLENILDYNIVLNQLFLKYVKK